MTTGLLLGAGASFELGMPLVNHLTPELFALFDTRRLTKLAEQWRGSESHMSSDQMQAIIDMMKREGQHYESVLGFLETEDHHDATPGKTRPFGALKDVYVATVHELLVGRHLFQRDLINEWLRFYDGLAGLAEANTPLWVFTLNHDVLIECIAARIGLPVSCGFSPERLKLRRSPGPDRTPRFFEAEVLREADLEHGLQFPTARNRGINLLKLHGALDTFTFNDTGEDLMRLLPVAAGPMGVIETLSAFNAELEPDHEFPCPTNERNAVEDNGTGRFLRQSIVAGSHKFETRHHQVWPHAFLQNFETNLGYVQSLVCIGYGFGDPHVNLKIRDWLEKFRGRRLTIVSPDAREAGLGSMLRHLANRIEYKQMSATDFFQQFAATPLSEAERKFKASQLEDIKRINARDVMQRTDKWLEHLYWRPKPSRPPLIRR